MQKEICEFLKEHDVEYKENYPLSEISSVKIGSKADFVSYPNTEEKIIELVKFLRKNKISYKIVGRMSNVLPSDKKYEGVILSTDKLKSYKIEDNYVRVSSGVSLPFLSKTTAEHGLSGFEKMCGIPGSVGGSVYGNAGAFGTEISDILEEVKIYDCDADSVFHLKGSDCGFTYRSSLLKGKNIVIISAGFRLTKSDLKTVKEKMRECSLIRRSTQPVGIPSLGSAFKRTAQNISAAKLIDGCGLKGFKIGGASVSSKHAGFIVNLGNSTAEDYLRVADYVSDRVFEKYGVNLEKEIEVM